MIRGSDDTIQRISFGFDSRFVLIGFRHNPKHPAITLNRTSQIKNHVQHGHGWLEVWIGKFNNRAQHSIELVAHLLIGKSGQCGFGFQPINARFLVVFAEPLP